MGLKPRNRVTFAEAHAAFLADPFDAELVALAQVTAALPVHADRDDTYVVRADGTTDVVDRAPPHASKLGDGRERETPDRLIALIHACAAARFGLRSPDARPTTSRTCWSCKGSGRTKSRGDYRYELDDALWLCGACVGRGWQRDQLAERRDNALLQVFGKCWTQAGFAKKLEADPHATLRAEDVRVADDVTVTIEINRQKNWCFNCQLSIPRIEASPGIVDADADYTRNMRVTIDDAATAPFLTLVVGHHRHICTCDEPDLYPFVFES